MDDVLVIVNIITILLFNLLFHPSDGLQFLCIYGK